MILGAPSSKRGGQLAGYELSGGPKILTPGPGYEVLGRGCATYDLVDLFLDPVF